MKNYSKLIILSVVLVVLIALITIFLVTDVDLIFIKSLSIGGIQTQKESVNKAMEDLENAEKQHTSAKAEIESAKNSFDVAKENYENIDESTVQMVQEATKDEKYFIEYLWIILGNYARENNLSINIVTPGSTASNNTTEGQNTAGASQANTDGKINIVVVGRYSDVADFVFDVENDKNLRFKLDNIKMVYSGDNKVSATFDVLSLNVIK